MLVSDAFVDGVVGPFIPTLLREQHVSEKDIQMATSLVIFGFGILDFIGAPLCALYIDRTSNLRIPFLGGVCIMALGTTIFGFGQAIWILFLGRMVQGFASALLYTVSLALLADTVPRNEVGKWLGVALSCNNIGMVLSPLFGGVIYDAAGKYAVFATTMALIGLDMFFRLFVIVEPKQTTTKTLSRIQTPESENTNYSGPQLSSRNGKTPNSPATRGSGILRLIRSPRLLVALYGIFLNECLNTTLTAVLPLFVDKTFGWSTLGAGLIFLTIAIPSIAGFAFGSLSDRFGPKIVATIGMSVAGPAIILLRLVKHDGIKQVALLCALLTITGIAINLFLASLSADISHVADQESRLQKEAAGIPDDDPTDLSLYAASFSLMNTVMASATLFGPLTMGWISEKHGWGTMTAVLGGIVLSGVVPCLLFTGGRERKDDREQLEKAGCEE
ncbi:hypothetical protein BLS_004384 [Venturia inaequalis]|uniref:Major facilitator superfamily (MFS) profile domain-containing protein n=1 Tax=Venturia inaequalis TaxID=5025 RepID=A0A8H3V8Q6_VENIN|nr:hypothetical protein BLS_004384 [Venturia inaequalis]